MTLIITKEGFDDYTLIVTDDIEDVNDGCSVRGTLQDILVELESMLTEPYNLVESDCLQLIDEAMTRRDELPSSLLTVVDNLKMLAD